MPPSQPGRRTSDQSRRRRTCRMICLDWAIKDKIISNYWSERRLKIRIATSKSSKNKWVYNSNNLSERPKINYLVTSPRCSHQVQTINHSRHKDKGSKILHRCEIISQIDHPASTNLAISHPKMLRIIEHTARVPTIVLGRTVVSQHHTSRLKTIGLMSHLNTRLWKFKTT